MCDSCWTSMQTQTYGKHGTIVLYFAATSVGVAFCATGVEPSRVCVLWTFWFRCATLGVKWLLACALAVAITGIAMGMFGSKQPASTLLAEGDPDTSNNAERRHAARSRYGSTLGVSIARRVLCRAPSPSRLPWRSDH